MFEWLRYRRDLKSLHEHLKHLDREFLAIEVNADNYYEKQPQISSLTQQSDEIEHRILLVQTEYYKRLCQRYALPIPDINNEDLYVKFDFDDEYGDRYLLNDKGIFEVRKLIREERKAIREEFGFWITMTVGLVGALTGLASVVGG